MLLGYYCAATYQLVGRERVIWLGDRARKSLVRRFNHASPSKSLLPGQRESMLGQRHPLRAGYPQWVGEFSRSLQMIAHGKNHGASTRHRARTQTSAESPQLLPQHNAKAPTDIILHREIISCWRRVDIGPRISAPTSERRHNIRRERDRHQRVGNNTDGTHR